MDKDIAVSVLITFHNQEEYVNKALGSVFSQITSFEYEVIIGDDDSTDNTVSLIKQWTKMYPQKSSMYTVSVENDNTPPGFRASRNRLNILQHVKGKYFIFLDGDDYFCDPYKLQVQVDILEKEENLECICCGHPIDALYSDGTTKRYGGTKFLKEGIVSAKYYWKYGYLHTNTLLFRSSVIDKLPYELLLNCFNDNLITFAIIQHGDVYYIDKVMAVYVQTNTGIWTGEKKAISYVRNMYMVDLCEMIGPCFKDESLYRLAGCWARMCSIREQIMVPDAYILYAKEMNLYNTLKWINYSNSNPVEKIILLVKTFLIILNRFLKYFIKRIKDEFKGKD